MTSDDLMLLRSAEGEIVALELTTGEQFFAEIQMVVDEPPTPDVFVLRLNREPDGVFVPARGTPEDPAGESILLAEIARVARVPGAGSEA